MRPLVIEAAMLEACGKYSVLILHKPDLRFESQELIQASRPPAGDLVPSARRRYFDDGSRQINKLGRGLTSAGTAVLIRDGKRPDSWPHACRGARSLLRAPCGDGRGNVRNR